jgi:TolA-binding protein
MADEIAIFESPIANFRLIEAAKPDASGTLIDVHIISPVWGSSGYYSESVLKAACQNNVYPEGMHMHLDHPTREAAKNQPARTISGESPLAAIFTEAGHYEAGGWDGPGVYTQARVLPKYVEDIKAMAGHIGISHYVDGVSEDGTAPDGRKGPIIKELKASPLNTVDFVTVPGAAGHYRTMFGEMKVRNDPNPNNQRNTMAEGNKQETLTLSEIRTAHPEVVTELKDQLREEMKAEIASKDQSQKLTEAATKIKALETENKTLKEKIADKAAREYVAAEIVKAKLPEASGKILTEQLVKLVILTEDGSVDAPAFGAIVNTAIETKKAEIADVLKENKAGITGNGAGAPPAGDGKALSESFTEAYIRMGKTPEQAKRLAESAVAGR